MLYTPALIIGERGIRSLRPLHIEIKWEEIDSIYVYRDAFAVDLSPSGLVSYFARQGKRPPRGLDITELQMAFSIRGANLPIPVDQLLGWIRERFSLQLERYHIEMENLDNWDNNKVIDEEGIVKVVKHRHLYGIYGALLVIGRNPFEMTLQTP